METSRRGFLQGVLATGGVLALAACGASARDTRIHHADQTGELVANLYVSVQASGRVTLVVNKAEIGQGVSTGYATLVAEELGVPLDHVDVQFAGSNDAMRTSANLQITGGSTSTAEAFIPLRKAAAAAREMLVAAAAQQWGVPAATLTVKDGAVHRGEHALPYGELTKAAARLPVPESPKLKPASEFTLVGKTSRRVDARGKIDGTAQFGIDVSVPNQCNAYAIHGPVFGAKPITVEAAAAKQRPGVIDVLAFDWGVAIVAEKFWQARAAAADVTITWDRGLAHGLDTEELRAALAQHDGSGPSVDDRGDADHAIKHSDAPVGGLYEAPYLAHATLEPQNATASVTGDHCELWAPTQSPTLLQQWVSAALGIPMANVTVHVTLCGGGFGRRAVGDVGAQAAEISKRVKRPVKLVWTRESDMTQAWYRPIFAVRAEGAVHAGKVTGARIHVMSQSLATSQGAHLFPAALSSLPGPVPHMLGAAAMALFSTSSFGDIFSTEGLAKSKYTFGNYRVTSEPISTKLPVAFWRSVGNSATGFVIEGLMDELAVATQTDPFALRRSLLPVAGKHTRALDALEELAAWTTPPAAGIGRGMARHFAFETECAQVVDVELVDGRIRVRRVYCVVDCGLAVNPDIVVAQMESSILFGLSAALDQEITLVDGVVQQRNYDTFPVLRMFESPEIIVKILPSDEKPTGVGEPGLPPVAPAVAAAIYRLTGKRLRRMPLQRALRDAGGAS